MATVALPFTAESARTVLSWGITENPPHTHAEIANWCERFWDTYSDTDTSPEIERILPVLADVECQWDIFLADYLSKHPAAAAESVRAPSAWFAGWIAEIEA
jgi:hypothetical protein